MRVSLLSRHSVSCRVLLPLLVVVSVAVAGDVWCHCCYCFSCVEVCSFRGFVVVVTLLLICCGDGCGGCFNDDDDVVIVIKLIEIYHTYFREQER